MNGHGGRRDGSGRKKLKEKHAEAIESLTDQCAAHAKPAFWRLWELIDPKPRYERKRIPSSLITRKDIARDEDGNVIRDDKGRPTIVEVPIFEGDGERLILVEEKEIEQYPDVRAIKELFDRFMGKAPQALELSNGDDGPLKIEVIYADVEPPSDTPEASRRPAEDPEGDQSI